MLINFIYSKMVSRCFLNRLYGKGKFRLSSSKLTSFILSARQNLMGIPLPIPSAAYSGEYAVIKMAGSFATTGQHTNKLEKNPNSDTEAQSLCYA